MKKDWDKELISYERFGSLCNNLAQSLEDWDFDFMCAPKRGGWMVGVHLSHYLNRPLYDVSELTKELCDSNMILVVDDIVDTGKTFIEINNTLTKFDIPSDNISYATLFQKPRAQFQSDYFIVSTSSWIVFPWEQEDEEPNRDYYDGDFDSYQKIRSKTKEWV